MKIQMRITWGFKTLVIVFISLFIVAAAFGVEISIGPGDMVLQTEEARKPAGFLHRQHQEAYSCTVCHHGYVACA
jgi:hypothetical protein